MKKVFFQLISYFFLATANGWTQSEWLETHPLLGDQQIVPVVAKTAGAGQPPTFWQSDVVIHNLNNYQKKVGLAYLPFDSANDVPVDDQGRVSFPVVLTLQPRETRLIEDVLGSLFHISGSAKGFLAIIAEVDYFPENAPPSGEENLLLVTTRTYNTGDPKGTYGQTVAGNYLLKNRFANPSFVTGARHGGRFRSNLGIVNWSDVESIFVHYRVLDSHNNVLGEGTREIPKLSGKQWSFSDLGVRQTTDALTVELWLDAASENGCDTTVDEHNEFAAYVSKVDGNPEGTGDAEFIWAIPRDFVPPGFEGFQCNGQALENPLLGRDQVVPVVAKTAGAGQPPTFWQSDVVIHNLNNYEKKVGLLYLPFDSPNDVPVDDQGRVSFPVVLTLQPGETKLIEDVLGSSFNISGSAKGVLFISSHELDFPENAPPPGVKNLILVTTRTYNTGDPKGTYGQTVAPNMLLLNGSPKPSFVTGARHGGRFRSNLGIVNISFEPILVHYRVLGSGGNVLAEGTREIPKLSGKQWRFSDLGVRQTTDALTVELWLDESSVTPNPCEAEWLNRFMGYVSKVDGNPEGTGDAEFIWAIPRDFFPPGSNCPQAAKAQGSRFSNR